MSTAEHQINATSWLLYWLLVLSVILQSTASFEFDKKVQEFSTSETLIAGLQHQQSSFILCSGVFLSSFYVLTVCKCLYSCIAVYPFSKKRIPERYLITDDNNNALEVSNFVSHPFCLRTKLKKPFNNHFGLVVLAQGRILAEGVAPERALFRNTGDVMQHLIQSLGEQSICHVEGHHSDAGGVQIGKTKVILMTAEDCLSRLCIPAVGCEDISPSIETNADFCFKVFQDTRLEARFLQGSAVICSGLFIGIVVSHGSSRYPKVPSIIADITQYVRHLSLQMDVE